MTPFTAFHVRRRLELNIEDWNPNDSGKIVLEEGVHLSRNIDLLEYLEENCSDVAKIDRAKQRFPGAAPPEKWPELKRFRGRVLIISPFSAIGDNVMFLCVLAALKDANPHLELGIAFVGIAHHAFRWQPGLSIYPYVVPAEEIKQYQGVVDLYNLTELNEHVYKPFDVETRLLEAFDVPPSTRIPGLGRPPRNPDRPRINIFPLATDPLRTIPPETTRSIAAAAAQFGPVSILLNPHQVQGPRYVEALDGDLPDNVEISASAMQVQDLIRVVSETDYGVFADSGPCHLAKLYDVMGFAIFTSIPASVRVARYRNLRVWQTKYQGRHCKAPCGLSMLLTTPSGKRGCWETLGPDHEGYRRSREIGDEQEFLRFAFEQPVPCVASLRGKAAALARAVADDILERVVHGRGTGPATVSSG